ncbi:hypothetical protein [Niveispirillum sp. KHB5.9]|uniref:hypothetical protein n=1 Tax=Niveispirillum sp. KHB5.9 TaxID=3400269 RepID=UPI003A84C17F
MSAVETGGEAGGDIAPLLRREVVAMVRYALGNGTGMPAELLPKLSLLDKDAVPLADLAELHGQLAGLVAPASPRTILLLAEDRYAGRLLSSFGPLPNVRRLLLAAVLFMLLFILASLSEHVNATTIRQDIYSLDRQHLLHMLIYLMSAAGLGASFNALSTAYRFVRAGTYDPRLDSSYWIRIVLGIIAGLLISQLVPLGAVEMPEATAAGHHGSSLGKPVLALLGGYSANMVNTVLQRLVETVQAMFKGDSSDNAAAQETSVRAKADHRVEQHKLSVAGDLLALHHAIRNGTPPAGLLALTGRLLNRTAPGLAPTDESTKD